MRAFQERKKSLSTELPQALVNLGLMASWAPEAPLAPGCSSAGPLLSISSSSVCQGWDRQLGDPVAETGEVIRLVKLLGVHPFLEPEAQNYSPHKSS